MKKILTTFAVLRTLLLGGCYASESDVKKEAIIEAQMWGSDKCIEGPVKATTRFRSKRNYIIQVVCGVDKDNGVKDSIELSINCFLYNDGDVSCWVRR